MIHTPDNIFTPGSKLQGNSTLTMTNATPAPTMFGATWPTIYNSPQYPFAINLLDITTIGNIPRVITISLGSIVSIPVIAGGGFPGAEVVAVFELGVGGLAYFTEIDFIQGIQFSISTSRFKLNAIYQALPGSIGGAGQRMCNIGAAASLGSLAHGRQPQRTLARQPTGGVALAIGAQERWQIPNFAKSFRVTALPNNSNLTFTLLNELGAGPGTFNALAYPSVDFPVPTDAQILTVTNTGLAAVTHYRMVFELAI